MANIRLAQIARKIDNTFILKDITFTVPDGAFWVLVGPSGCGKSTILRTIAGLESATSGDIYLGDRPVNQVPARQRDVAMVFQNYALYPHMTVAENLAFGLRMRQVDPVTRQARVTAVAQQLGIEHLLNRKPSQLSGGQQQRVALGRAIARQPQAFLLDEPLSNLDAQLREQTRAELKQLHQQVGITTLYVTHDQTEAMTLADQMVVLHQGEIQQIGEPQAIYQRPANRMVASFLGNPAMNLLAARYHAGKLIVGDQILPCPASLEGVLHADQWVELGIRPEALHLRPVEPPLPDACLQVVCEVVEPLGREILVRAALQDQKRSMALYFLAAATQRVNVGDRLVLSLDRNDLFIFDGTTGLRLYPSI